jgi:hypothetical protein
MSMGFVKAHVGHCDSTQLTAFCLCISNHRVLSDKPAMKGPVELKQTLSPIAGLLSCIPTINQQFSRAVLCSCCARCATALHCVLAGLP